MRYERVKLRLEWHFSSVFVWVGVCVFDKAKEISISPFQVGEVVECLNSFIEMIGHAIRCRSYSIYI